MRNQLKILFLGNYYFSYFKFLIKRKHHRHGAAIGVIMEIQLAVSTPTTTALGSMPILRHADVTRGIKIVRVARFDIACVKRKRIVKNTAIIIYGYRKSLRG